MGAGRFQGTHDVVQHRLSFLEYLVIPEPKHAISLRFNPAVTMLIMVMAFIVLPSIKLDDEPRFKTREIGDIAANGDLAAKTIPAKLAAS